MKKILAAAAVLATLGGCASAGTEVQPAQASQFTKGVTTYSGVVSKLGQPNMVIHTDDGDTVATYSYVNTQVRAASFIPIVGFFAGGADTKSTSVIFTFDKRGTLKSYSTSQMSMGSQMGAANYR